MEDVLDIRWKQRFENFKRAYTRLSDAILTIESLHDTDSATLELMEEGLIQRFEYTHELAWNVLKDYLHYEGYNDINGSRSAIRKALAIGLIEDRRWMDSINDRNLT
ncbi:MAG: HI0074 family nucleotidyltransferase substrate-binding subunit, partial [Prevotellaceae bacterium]|nr:HI0074 family nucleotidyltransferase substrate-binding subunit [Prevotellaceae bacterium]